MWRVFNIEGEGKRRQRRRSDLEKLRHVDRRNFARQDPAISLPVTGPRLSPIIAWPVAMARFAYFARATEVRQAVRRARTQPAPRPDAVEIGGRNSG